MLLHAAAELCLQQVALPRLAFGLSLLMTKLHIFNPCAGVQLPVTLDDYKRLTLDDARALCKWFSQHTIEQLQRAALGNLSDEAEQRLKALGMQRAEFFKMLATAAPHLLIQYVAASSRSAQYLLPPSFDTFHQCDMTCSIVISGNPSLACLLLGTHALRNNLLRLWPLSHRITSTHLEGNPEDTDHMTRCQRAALAAAGLSDDQKSDIIAAYSETLREVQKLEKEVQQLRAQLAEAQVTLAIARCSSICSHVAAALR